MGTPTYMGTNRSNLVTNRRRVSKSLSSCGGESQTLSNLSLFIIAHVMRLSPRVRWHAFVQLPIYANITYPIMYSCRSSRGGFVSEQPLCTMMEMGGDEITKAPHTHLYLHPQAAGSLRVSRRNYSLGNLVWQPGRMTIANPF